MRLFDYVPWFRWLRPARGEDFVVLVKSHENDISIFIIPHPLLPPAKGWGAKIRLLVFLCGFDAQKIKSTQNNEGAGSFSK
jgi:hypothetical protein